MISFDFAYYRPLSIEEAISQFQDLRSHHKKVIYYGGGTEFISRARREEIQADAVIDLKYIPNCNTLKIDQQQIILGSAITLTEVVNTDFFPLLSKVVRQIATQTERNKITIGGNISSHLPYREALMPFLLADSKIVIAGKKGIRTAQVVDVYKNGIELEEDEFIVQIITDQKFAEYPHFNCKQTKQSKVNYPIVSLAALKTDEQIRVACSGVCDFPFRFEGIETKLNDPSTAKDEKVNKAISYLPTPLLDDLQASAPYREFVLKNVLTKMLDRIGSN